MDQVVYSLQIVYFKTEIYCGYEKYHIYLYAVAD